MNRYNLSLHLINCIYSLRSKMKKALSILFALLVLVSGTHLTIAKHICGGELAAVKWSFTGQKASCGMVEDLKTHNSEQNAIESNCCHNELSTFTVDSNYSPSSLQLKDITEVITHVFALPATVLFQSTVVAFSSHSYFSPPDIVVSNISQADICVFRI